MALPASGFAQAPSKHSLNLSVGPELSFPEKRFSRTHGRGIGGSLKLEYVFGKHAAVTLNTALLNVWGKTLTNNSLTEEQPDLMMVTVKPGLRYYVGDVYVAGEAGIGFLQNQMGGNGFVYSVGIGDKIRIGETTLDVGLRHEGWQVTGFRPGLVVFRLAFERTLR